MNRPAVGDADLRPSSVHCDTLKFSRACAIKCSSDSSDEAVASVADAAAAHVAAPLTSFTPLTRREREVGPLGLPEVCEALSY